MYQQVPDPVGGSLGLSALFAVLPLVTLFVLLAGLRLRAYLAILIALAVAVTVAIAVYGMPVGQTVLSALAGPDDLGLGVEVRGVDRLWQ